MLIGFGVVSCLVVVLLSRRMHIVDEEGVPVQLGRASIYRLCAVATQGDRSGEYRRGMADSAPQVAHSTDDRSGDGSSKR